MKKSALKPLIIWKFMVFVSIMTAIYSDGNHIVIFLCAIFAAFAGIYLGISINEKNAAEKSSAQIIADQTAEIAELRRGIGDIFIKLFVDENHNSIKNGDEMISSILRKLYKHKEEEKK